jgi:centromere/kinetochore protein ZW10
VSGRAVHEAEDRVVFLSREAEYNAQVHHALVSVRDVHELLNEVERARDDRRVLDSLQLLEGKISWRTATLASSPDFRAVDAWSALSEMLVSKSCRIIRVLDMRASELKSTVHHVFDRVWGSLVRVQAEGGTVEIYGSREGASTPPGMQPHC